MNPFINVGINQVIWFLCVLGGNAGAFFALPLLVANIVLSRHRRADLQMTGLLLLSGVFIDGILQTIGFFSFTSAGFPIPLWLAVIWAALAALPHHSLAWMKKRRLLSVIFGAFGGPLAYWAGVRLGAATFHWPLLSSLALLAVVWAFLWTGVMAVAARQTLHQAGNPASPG
ncbi:MAG: DUF2878 domain-containing protein [Proteobacteria bacterium]|nr:DUF2878 domain-containing protein [Pseudomonadota bacterium]